jgi:prepilin-type N-terminal cleavage/methylation domain-containing protein
MRINKRGYTLVELLIVMAIVAILAVALLAAIDPIEQLKRARDSRTRVYLKELLSATDRFVTGNFLWPWNKAAYGWDVAEVVDTQNDPFVITGNIEWAELLEKDYGELKRGYYERLKEVEAETGFVKSEFSGIVYGCFVPSSEQYYSDAVERCGDVRNWVGWDTTPGGPLWVCGGVPVGSGFGPDQVYWCMP